MSSVGNGMLSVFTNVESFLRKQWGNAMAVVGVPTLFGNTQHPLVDPWDWRD
jgi:hypothetical protein